MTCGESYAWHDSMHMTTAEALDASTSRNLVLKESSRSSSGYCHVYCRRDGRYYVHHIFPSKSYVSYATAEGAALGVALYFASPELYRCKAKAAAAVKQPESAANRTKASRALALVTTDARNIASKGGLEAAEADAAVAIAVAAWKSLDEALCSQRSHWARAGFCC